MTGRRLIQTQQALQIEVSFPTEFSHRLNTLVLIPWLKPIFLFYLSLYVIEIEINMTSGP